MRRHYLIKKNSTGIVYGKNLFDRRQILIDLRGITHEKLLILIGNAKKNSDLSVFEQTY